MRGLNRLYYIKIEIENLKEEIKNLPTISSTDLSGMPHGTNVNNPIEKYLLKKEALIEKLNIKIAQYTEELIRIEGIIDSIEDEEVKVIARMRFIQCMKWEDIGDKIHLERTTCSKKLRKYLKTVNIPTNPVKA